MKINKRKYNKHSNALKLAVIKEVQSGQLTKSQACRKYGISGIGTLTYWLEQLGWPAVKRTAPPAVQHQDATSYRVQELEKEVKQLKRQLEDETLLKEGYAIMIDIAENQLGIPIRKKSSTKQ